MHKRSTGRITGGDHALTEWSPETDSCDDILSLIFTKIGALVTSVAPPHLFGYKRLGAILLEQTLAA